jgi:hypothetical protein
VEIPHPKTYHAEFIAAAKKNRREIGTEIPIRIKLRAIMQGNYAAPHTHQVKATLVAPLLPPP